MKAEMVAESVLEILELLDAASIEAWLDGGWAVDALLEEQTRRHGDVDVIGLSERFNSRSARTRV